MTLRTVPRLDEIEQADTCAARLLEAEAAGPPAVAPSQTSCSAIRRRSRPIFVSRFLQQLRTLGASHCHGPPASSSGSRGGGERRGRHLARHPPSRPHPGHDGEQHHQPARHRADGLEDLRRAAEPSRGRAPRGSLGLLPADDVRHPRPLPARGRADRQADPAGGGGGGAAGGGAGGRGRPGATPGPARARRLLSDRRGPGAAGARHRVPPRSPRRRSIAGSGGTRTSSSSAAWSPSPARRSPRCSGSAALRPGPRGFPSCCSDSFPRTTSRSTS